MRPYVKQIFGLVIVLCCLPIHIIHGQFVIKSQSDLKELCKFPDSSFSLANDVHIDPSTNWTPCEFHGKLFGNGHTIFNLRVIDSIKPSVGLFTKISPSSIYTCNAPLWSSTRWLDSCNISNNDRPYVSNLKFENANIFGIGTTGILAGEAQFAEISKVEASGNVEGLDGVGALLGMAGPLADISQCKTMGNVRGRNFVGGLTGSLFFSQITESESDVFVTGQDEVGGIGGRAGSSVISEVSSRSHIQARDTVGGIIGAFYGSNQGKVHLYRKGCTELYSNFDGNFLEAFHTDEYGSYYVDRREIVDGIRYKYLGYSSSNEPDGNLPYFNFWYGKIGDSRFDYAAKQRRYSDNLSDCTEVYSGVSVESRLFLANSAGEIECRNVCGGIVGSNVKDVVSLSHVIHSGLISGIHQIGQFTGVGTALVRPLNYISSGLVLTGTAPWKLFGMQEKNIGWVLQLSPPRLQSATPSNELIGFSRFHNFNQSSKNIRWFGRFYPTGLYLPKTLKDSSVRFERFSKRKLSEPCWFLLEREWIHKEFGGCESVISKQQAAGFWRSMTYSYIEPFFPPIPKRSVRDVSIGECINLRDIFSIDNKRSIEFSLRGESQAWALNDSVLCRVDSSTNSPALVLAKNGQNSRNGQTWFRVFPKTSSPNGPEGGFKR